MQFQVAECNAVSASVLLNLINNNFLTFLTKNLPILNPYFNPQNPKICDPIIVTPVEKMQPHSDTSPLASCEGVPPLPGNFYLQLDIDQN